MKRWMPRVIRRGWCNAEDHVEHEGISIDVYWLDLIFQFAIGREDRRI